MTRWLLALLTLTLMVLSGAVAAQAHEVRPAYLEITEPAPGDYQVLWKQPVMGDLALPLAPKLSNSWLDGAPAETSVTAGSLVKIWRIHSDAPAPLDHATVAVTGLDLGITDALVSVSVRDRPPIETILNADRPSVALAFGEHGGLPTLGYLRLGIEHILTGVDHLSFVLGLLLLVGFNRRLLGAVTAFTAAHSLTLAAAALHWIKVPSATVEALVALSILFIALEVVRAQRGETGLTQRRPWLIAFIFGLLHGMAFAGALAQIGLPPNAIPQALFLFNAGVEIGQLMFIAAAAVVLITARQAGRNPRVSESWLAIGRAFPAYAIGAFAAYWFLERTAVAFRLIA